MPTSAPSPSLSAVAPPRGSPRQRQWLLALSLLLIACNLRPVFGSLSVVLPEVMRDTGLSAAGASLLTTLPIVCLGLFSAPTPWLSRRFGAERVLLLALLLIASGTLLRAAGSLPWLFTSAVLAGAGIAMGNVLLPSLVKRHFAAQAALMTGMYILAICIGATAATASTVPLSIHWFAGAWPYALAVWGVPALLVLLLWLPQALRMHTEPIDPAARTGSLWRDKLAWQVTAFMGLQSALAYIVMGWLAPILRERGLDSALAGYVVALSTLAQFATSLMVPSIAARCRDQRALAVGMPVLVFAALAGLILAPLSTVWPWALLLGCAQGGLFALALSLIAMRSGDAQVTAQLSAMAQGWGYLLAAFGPLLTGLLHEWTGSFTSSVWLILLLSAGMAWSGWGAGRNLLVQPATRAP